jgi:MFS family permease
MSIIIVPPAQETDALERNLELYPRFLAAQNLLFWMPVFFLYLTSLVSLEQALALESLYYLGVVLLEVPSGYFSDRLGRRPTLVIAALCWCASYLLFAAAGSFASLAVAQLLLAAGWAFNSGTDSSIGWPTC